MPDPFIHRPSTPGGIIEYADTGGYQDVSGWELLDYGGNGPTGRPSSGYNTKTCKLIVKYKANGGSGDPPEPSEVTYSGKKQKVKLSRMVKGKSSSLTRSGYNFLGWSTNSNATAPDSNYDPGSIITETWEANESGKRTIELYAIWTSNGIITYKPGQYANEASAPWHDKYSEAPLNQATTLRGELYTRVGYHQTGWQTGDSQTLYNLEDSYTATSTSSLTLYPVWFADAYEIIYEPNGAEGQYGYDYLIYKVFATYDSDITIRSDSGFYKTGYYISQWNEKSDGSGPIWIPGETYLYKRTEGVVLYAIWESNEYHVIYDDNGSDDHEVSVNGIIYSDLLLDENNALYSEGDNLVVASDRTLYMKYPGSMRYALLDVEDGNYSIARYGTAFYTDRRPISKYGYSFVGWKASDGTILTKQDAWMDAYSFGEDPTWTRREDVVLTPIWSEEYPFGKIFYGRKESSDYGIVVEQLPDYYWPERPYTHTSIDGKNGDILTDLKKFSNVTKTYDVAVYNKNGFYDSAQGLSEFLHRYNGYGNYVRLEDSYEPDVYMLAVYQETKNVENILGEAGKAQISFSCKPQKFLYTGNRQIEIFESGTVINNPTSYPSAPLIKIWGTGTIHFLGCPNERLDGSAAEVKDVELVITANYNGIILDCDTFNAANGFGLNMNPYVGFMDPIRLYPGNNTITYEGDFYRIVIIPRWWRL